ncbi:hypothetical protein CORMATOL_00221 [Corynebacterium matruchotii ATCC 33806]|uniref:Uncharacterized protein n=1 Tax=Corynebacterium matruchotii ATCC 33806 TaxID=566549 RepID=C0DZS5_9CORY|nr:hypothetical protein CORMATOL_00221 [Corynebacterium matruchotii ATCC 33806]
MQGGLIGWEALAWAARAVSPWLMYWLLKLIFGCREMWFGFLRH